RSGSFSPIRIRPASMRRRWMVRIDISGNLQGWGHGLLRVLLDPSEALQGVQEVAEHLLVAADGVRLAGLGRDHERQATVDLGHRNGHLLLERREEVIPTPPFLGPPGPPNRGVLGVAVGGELERHLLGIGRLGVAAGVVGLPRGLVVDDRPEALDGEEGVGLAGVAVPRVVDDDLGGLIRRGEALEPLVEAVQHEAHRGRLVVDTLEAAAALLADEGLDLLPPGPLAGQGVAVRRLMEDCAQVRGREPILGAAEAGVAQPLDDDLLALLLNAGGDGAHRGDRRPGGLLRGPIEQLGLVEDADDRGDGPEDEVVGSFLSHVLDWLAELIVEGDDVRHATPFQTRPRTMCCMCLRWTPYSSASCAWVTPPAFQRARISRTCSGVSLERLGGRYLTGCGVRARSRFARARRTSWY